MKNRYYLYVKAFSDLGSMMDTMVLNILIYNLTESAFWLSAAMGAGVVGGMLSSLYSGVLADRLNRKRLMIVSDCMRALLILVLILFPSPAIILLVRFAVGFTGSFFEVSFNAEIPQIYGEKNVITINSILARLRAFSLVGGFIGAGVISEFMGYRTVLLLDSMSYLVSAAILLRMRWTYTSHSKETGQTRVTAGKKGRFLQELKEVKGYFALQPLLHIAFWISLIDTFGSSSHNLGIPLLATQMDPSNQSLLYGLIWGTWGIGNVFASYVMPRIPWIQNRLGHTYLVSTIFMSAGFITFLSSASVGIVFPFALLTGIADAVAVTTFGVYVQQTDNYIRGRILGISSMANRLGFGIGFLVAPLLLKSMTLPHMVWVLHGTIISSCIIAIFIAYRVVSKNARIKVSAPGA